MEFHTQLAVNGYDYVEVTAKKFFGDHDQNLLIDEAQLTYDSRLWYTVTKARIGRSSGPRLYLFGSYGSPSTGAAHSSYAQHGIAPQQLFLT